MCVCDGPIGPHATKLSNIRGTNPVCRSLLGRKNQRNIYKEAPTRARKQQTTNTQNNKQTIHKANARKKGHSIERVWYTASREPSDTPPRLTIISHFHPKQRHITYNSVLSGFQVSLSAQSTPLGESLGST